jgi:thiol-disulfide isomerase/thioredoxin
MMKKFAIHTLAIVAAFSLARAESPAEQQVSAAIKAPNISVVHLWAPWCSNCQAELKSGGWKKMVKENPQAKFYFVSVWDKGDDRRAILTRNGIANAPNVTILADPGPRGADHIKEFAGEKFSWIPTTWVYKGGNLEYALNYGEIHFPLLQQCIADTSSSWEH